MAATPDVVERLAGNIQWTTDLGNAFLDQQEDVLAAVQRMRAKAQGTGALKTSQEQTGKLDGGRQQGGHRYSTAEPGSCLRSFLRSGGCLRAARLSLLPVYLPRVRAGHGTRHGDRHHPRGRVGEQ